MASNRGLVLLAAALIVGSAHGQYRSARQMSGGGGGGSSRGGGSVGNGVSGGRSNPGDVEVSCPHARAASCSGIPPQFRPIDGSCHKADGILGMSGTPYTRVLNANYADGFHAPRAGVTRAGLPSPREIVNRLHIDVDVPNPVVNHFFMNWGQLVAHDITLLDTDFPEANSGCCAQAARGSTTTCSRIDIPGNDPFFRRAGVSCLGVIRAGSQVCERSYHDQRNMVTHYMDASHVYGSDRNTGRGLRAFNNGLLRFRSINGEEHLPLNNEGDLFAGDARVVVTAMLSAMHTVFMREHNRLARGLARVNPHWNDERLYQEARRILIAEWQLFTYRDWLERLIGRAAVTRNNLRPVASGYSQDYSAQTDPRTSNDFAAAAFRSFHSLIQNNIWLGRNGQSAGSVIDVPATIVQQNGGLLGVIEGMLYQPSQEQDQFMADEIRNRMFANTRPIGGDLISTDIMRGRDHGLPSYNAYRQTCGLSRATSWQGFSDLISSRNIQILQSLYAHPDDVDYYVGALLERRSDTSSTSSITSPTFQCVVVDQFRRYKTGDPYFFDLAGPAQRFTPAQLAQIRQRTVARLLCDNVRNLNIVPRDVFLRIGVEGNSNVQCNQLPAMDLSPWREETQAQQQRTTANTQRSRFWG